jgi:mRNA-degrading endonuclease toxin of MazEF toxin-antitoxin module
MGKICGEKGHRLVVIVSANARNLHERANTVLVVPLSTTPARAPTHIQLTPGETGLAETSSIRSEATLHRIARAVTLAMGFILE